MKPDLYLKKLSEEEAKKELEHLSSEISRHDQLYYQESNPIIDDSTYDALRRRNTEIEKAFPNLVREDSPSYKIGAPPQKTFSKIRHHVPMLSLGNAFDNSEIEEFISRIRRFLNLSAREQIELVCEPKIDGLSASIRYENGIYTHGATRGNGEEGEDVTENLRTIQDIPTQLSGVNIPEIIEVRGEVYMPRETFKQLNEENTQRGVRTFVNPRNAASGGLRQIDPRLTAKRKLRFFAYSLGEMSEKPTGNYIDILGNLRKWGFQVNTLTTECKTTKDWASYYQNIVLNRDKLSYEIDGVVIKVNRLDWQYRLGAVGREPRWAIAYKFAAESAETRLKNISIQVGRTGTLTPVAELLPVSVGGVTIKRANLHNADEIKRKDIREGDYVIVQRAGDVIPQIANVLPEKRKKHSMKYEFPSLCPECGSEAIRAIGEAATRCSGNLICPAQAIEHLRHFVSRDAFNIDGLGEKQIQNLWKKHLIRTPVDIFKLEEMNRANEDTLLAHEGWGEKSAANLFTAIASSKNISLEKLIYALGIRHIGQNTSKLLARHYRTFDVIQKSLIAASDRDSQEFFELKDIDGIGNAAANALVDFFNAAQNLLIISELTNILEISSFEAPDTKSPITGRTIVFTGTLLEISRAEAKAQAEAFGAKVSSSVSKKTDYVVAGKDSGTKLKKAKELNINVLSEADWIAMLESSL